MKKKKDLLGGFSPLSCGYLQVQQRCVELRITHAEDGRIYETVVLEKPLSAARDFPHLVCQMSTSCFSVLAPLPRRFQCKKD